MGRSRIAARVLSPNGLTMPRCSSSSWPAATSCWASGRPGELGLSGDKAAAYAKAIITTEFEAAGDEGVFAKLRADLDKAKFSDHAIRHHMMDFLELAAEQVQAESAK